MVKLHCKYYTRSFSMWNFQVFVVSLLCMYLFLFLGMSKVIDTPSPHSSRKQRKCGSCHSFLTDLDPHPDCSKCVPRGCSSESPCSHCAPLSQDAWKKWECQQCSKRSSSSTKGPKGDSAKGGNKPGKVCPDVAVATSHTATAMDPVHGS